MKNLLHRFEGLALLWVIAATGCSAADDRGSGEATVERGPSGSGVEALQRDLSLGAQGSDVVAVHEYLTEFGYFPNQQLARSYPQWRPIVAKGPAQAEVYDAQTVQAVRALQEHDGLEQTGIVDSPTRELMQTPRCGVPDGIPRLDPTDKFALLQGLQKWDHSPVTYRVTTINGAIVDGVQASLATINRAVDNATNTWSAFDTGVVLRKIESGTPDIEIFFGSDENSVYGRTTHNPTRIKLNTDKRWSTSSSTPTSRLDLESGVLHELGHSLGLGHTSRRGTVMYFSLNRGSQRRVLRPDDYLAIKLLYGPWQWARNDANANYWGANDVGANASDAVWVTGTVSVYGGFPIYKYVGSQFKLDQAGGAAVRVAVDSNGAPWVVNSLGNIYIRSSSNPATGFWSDPLPGLATDIGIGRDNSVWVIGVDLQPRGGYGIYKWSPAIADWERESAYGAAVRIAVDPNGIPWVVNSEGAVYRRTSADPTTGGWDELPGQLAWDVGIDPNGYGWIVSRTPVAGGGYQTYVWDEQVRQVDGKGQETSQGRSEWVPSNPVPEGAFNISPGTYTWTTNSSGELYYLN